MTEVTYIAALTCFQGIGGKTFTKIEKRCSELSITFEEFYTLKEIQIFKEFSFLRKKFISDFIVKRDYLYTCVCKELTYMEKFNVFPILRNNPIYPNKIKKHLGIYAPPILYITGNLNLLKINNVGVIGTRKPSMEGIKFTHKIVRDKILENKLIVSGYAKGIDYHAHFSSLYNHGKTIFVLPYSIEKFNNKIFKELETKKIDYFDVEDNYLIISEFLKYSSINAKSMPIIRNRLIASLSDEIYVMEADLKSGTINTVLKAVEFGVPINVIDYSKVKKNPFGNQFLIEKNLNTIEFYDEEKKYFMNFFY